MEIKDAKFRCMERVYFIHLNAVRYGVITQVLARRRVNLETQKYEHESAYSVQYLDEKGILCTATVDHNDDRIRSAYSIQGWDDLFYKLDKMPMVESFKEVPTSWADLPDEESDALGSYNVDLGKKVETAFRQFRMPLVENSCQQEDNQ